MHENVEKRAYIAPLLWHKIARKYSKSPGIVDNTKDDILSNFLKHYAIIMEGKMNVSELAQACGMSSSTVYKHMKMMG